MEENDRDDELESDMIDNRRACFYIEMMYKVGKVKDVHLIAESIASFLKFRLLKCYNSFALATRRTGFFVWEVCIRISFVV